MHACMHVYIHMLRKDTLRKKGAHPGELQVFDSLQKDVNVNLVYIRTDRHAHMHAWIRKRYMKEKGTIIKGSARLIFVKTQCYAACDSKRCMKVRYTHA